jgi:hypothetical protein
MGTAQTATRGGRTARPTRARARTTGTGMGRGMGGGMGRGMGRRQAPMATGGLGGLVGSFLRRR